MAVLQTLDGRLLSRRRPAGDLLSGGGFRSDWTDARPNGDDDWDSNLVSYAGIYTSQPWVAAAIDKVSRHISTLPLKAYRRVDDHRRERLPHDHSLSRLLRSPLPRKGAVDTKQWISFPLYLHGNSLLGKIRERPGGPPVSLMPLDWRYVSGYGRKGAFVEWWSTTQFGDERFVSVEDVVHVAWQGPDPEFGISPLQKLGTTIKLENAVQRQQVSSFANGIFPSIAVTVGPGRDGAQPSKEMLDLTRASLEGLLRGPDKAFRALMVAPGTEVKPISITAREAELSEQRYINREDISAVIDIPPPLLGDLRHATLANLKEFGRQWYQDILRPQLTLIEERLQAQLIDNEDWGDDDLYVEFDLSEKLKGDPLELAKTIQIQIASGQLTPNEGRAKQNEAPSGDPDDPANPANQLYLPRNNLQPLDAATEEVPQLGGPAADAPQPPPPSQALTEQGGTNG